MAVRTTATAVGKIIDVDADDDIDPFIESANALVEEILTPHKKTDGTLYYGNVRLELIERWLSAHFYAILRPQADMEKAGPVAQKSQYKVDLVLNQTRWGQKAMLLDTSGLLASLSKATEDGKLRKAEATWLGTEFVD